MKLASWKPKKKQSFRAYILGSGREHFMSPLVCINVVKKQSNGRVMVSAKSGEAVFGLYCDIFYFVPIK